MLLKIIVSGEGPSDLGGSKSGQAFCLDDDFERGPFYELIIRMLNRYLPQWNKECYETLPLSTIYVSHGFLKRKAKELSKGNGKYKFASKNSHKGEHGKFKQARELAKLATDHECQIAIYFHDTDGNNETKSLVTSLQSDIVNAIDEGFVKGGLSTGVAMIPKPTSEAWLICSCKANPYQNCEELEVTLSGNDRSPNNAPKKILADYLNLEKCTPEKLKDEVFKLDYEQINMPSFNQFRDDLKGVIRMVCGSVME